VEEQFFRLNLEPSPGDNMPVDQYSWPYVDVTIASGQSLSSVAYTNRANVIGIIMPSAWTTANLTFEASIDGDTFYDFFDPFNQRQHVHADASRFIGGLDVLAFGSFNYLKVRSGTPAAPVAQAETRVIRLVLRDARYA
jgi:hypothetical protein